MTACKAPTASAISALLRRNGFARSNHGAPGVGFDKVTTGFVAWKTFQRDHPEQPYVAVQYDVAGMYGIRDGDEWNAYLAEARARLEEYAAVARKAGYHAVVRDRADAPPWLTILTVVAREEAGQ